MFSVEIVILKWATTASLTQIIISCGAELCKSDSLSNQQHLALQNLNRVRVLTDCREKHALRELNWLYVSTLWLFVKTQ